MMDPEKKAAWVAALRSGEYTQARKALRTTDNKYCCLGVYCELNEPGAWKVSNECEKALVHTGFGNTMDLLRKHMVLDDLQVRELIEMNDGGTSFTEIATHIEENL